jgi:alpha-glucosidase
MPGLGLGRDPARTPMQWDERPNAGFCPPEALPWLPLAEDSARTNVAVERRDPRSMLTLTRAIIHLRRALPALTRGTYAAIPAADSGSAGWHAYLRVAEGQRILVVVSFACEEQRISLPGELGGGRVLLSTTLGRDEQVNLGDLLLSPYEGCVIGLE